MGYTSAVCVLVGSETWLRRWVRYEIARAVIDELGLLAVHINSIRHHQRLTTDALGPNPLEYMAVGKVQDGALVRCDIICLRKRSCRAVMELIIGSGTGTMTTPI